MHCRSQHASSQQASVTNLCSTIKVIRRGPQRTGYQAHGCCRLARCGPAQQTSQIHNNKTIETCP
jgi:hypothetical protein